MARAPKITDKWLDEQICAGRGTGFDNRYLPLLFLARWNPSKVSTQNAKPIPPFSRQCYCFSQSEWFVALIIAWAGGLIREQFPLWPWPHPHPEYGRHAEDDHLLPWSVGMLDICRSAGIKHGTFVGTRIDYIWSMDLCVHLPWILDPRHRTTMVSVKPLESNQYISIDPLARGPEKLEAERRYCEQIGAHYFVSDASLFPTHLHGELESLCDSAVLSKTNPMSEILQQFLDADGGRHRDETITDTHTRLQIDFGADQHQATFLLNHMLWTQLIDCDLTRPVIRSLPPKPGGRRFRQTVRQLLSRGIE